MIKQTIKDDSVALLKEGKTEESVMLRNVLAEMNNVEIERKHELTDAEAVAVLHKLVKKLEDAVIMFEEGGRDDLAEENKLEIAALSKYLPAEMSDEELEKNVRTALEKLDPSIEGGRRIGAVVRELASLEGAEPSRISKMVQKIIA